MGVRLESKPSLQEVTNVGSTTTNNIIHSNTTLLVKFGSVNATTAYLGTMTNNSLVFRANDSSVGIMNPDGSWAFGDSNTNNKAIVTMNSTTKGFSPPRMTTTQKNAITGPTEGLVLYDLTLHKLCVYNGTTWETVTSI